jgi:DNA-binding XRE family transcriptional regulator
METDKRQKLESKGWKVGTADDFLGLSKAESDFIELKLTLSKALFEQRKHHRMTQAELARRLKTSQSRVAKMEKGDPTVTVDLLIRSLLTLDVPKKRIGEMIS